MSKKRFIKDGKVAVLVSPGYGAGWSTWNEDYMREYLCMDPELVQAVLDGNPNKAAKLASEHFSVDVYVCTLGSDQLVVMWVPQGESFKIEEYDGSESLEIRGMIDWLVA